MPLDVVLGAMVFFWDLTNVLLNYIPSYLENQIKQEQIKEAVSIENGEVIQNYIFLAKETLQDLKKSLDYRYISA